MRKIGNLCEIHKQVVWFIHSHLHIGQFRHTMNVTGTKSTIGCAARQWIPKSEQMRQYVVQNHGWDG